MFNTKLEVDRHVENCLKKINNELERNLRCFAFAKLYYKVGDYEQAHRYTCNYLHVKPQSAEGQHLLGKVLEKLRKKEAALEAYKRSLELDPKQNNLVLKVCELLASEDINFDLSGARYFCEKAQNVDPYNPVVFQLKERLIESESKDPNDVSNLLLKELESRPTNVDIRIRLLKHLLQNNKVADAYKHACDVENLSVFGNNLAWYETLNEVLLVYQKEHTLKSPSEYWMLLVSVQDRLVSLSLDERTANVRNGVECVAAVFNFDQNLKTASEHLTGCSDKQFVQEFLNHYTGQLCLHFVTLLFKYARKDLIKYKEALQLGLPVLFVAYNFLPASLQSMWFEHLPEKQKVQIQRWNREASFRCSQAGHMLTSIAKERKTVTIEKAVQASTGMWREHTYKKIFVSRDQQLKMKSSYFITCPQLVDVTIRLPDVTDLQKYDNVAQLIFPDVLHNHIWIGLNNKLSDFTCSVFQGLPYSVKNLNHCAAESLSVLDVEAFIYCAVLCAKTQMEENRQTIYYNAEKPNVLPAAVTEQLGTTNQAKWLKCAYKMFKNEHDGELGDIRVTLIRGLECIRCVGNHGLDVKLLVAVAKIFAERSTKLNKQSEVEYNDARSELYWKTALPLLEKLRKNQAISYASNRMFEYKIKEMSQSEIVQNIDEGKLFIATQLIKKKDYEKALALLEVLKDPYASFYQAQIYKSMADKETSQNRENLTSEMRSQHIILLTKSRDCLYLTLDRLRDVNVDRKHPLNEKLGTEIEKIERLLSRIDPDMCVNRNECDGMSDENVSSIESENYLNSTYHTTYTNGNFNRQDNVNSTPYRLDHLRREARPSPERLDAQLRQLVAAKDSAINQILEQNKVVLDSHKTLVDEVKTFTQAVTSLVSTVEELKQIKQSVEDIKGITKSVNELKVAVDEMQSFKNVTDIVLEMRKEIADLKKDTHKIRSNQLSDEDLYVLDEEYGADYANINSNVPGLAPSIYPNLSRLPPAANSLAYAAPALYHGMYPMYPYPGLGLPQAGALPFGHDPQLASEFRAMSSLSQGLNQPGLTPSGYQQQALQTPQPLPHAPAALPPTSLQTTFGQPHMPGLQQPMGNIFKETSTSVLTSPMFSTSITTTASSFTSITPNKNLPVNVVITASDPLPSSKTVTTPQILSVTIPPHHIKGNKAHNYQISLPSTTTSVTSVPQALTQTPMPVATQSLLSNVAPPVYSAIADKSPHKNTSLGFQIEKSLSQSFNKSANETDPLNQSTISVSSQDEHDPCPDFKPIIPLPDEVPVNTGEENETALFCERAQLFRFGNKEWKERGVGELKLLKNAVNGKIRLLMRRDQVHKISANHYVTKDMNIIPKGEKGFIWAANDYADGQLVLEKFCVQFKTPEVAKKFSQEFEKCKQSLSATSTSTGFQFTATPTFKAKEEPAVSSQATPITNLGGFKFTSTPTFKPKEEEIPGCEKPVSSEAPKTSPFASFTFNKDTPNSGSLTKPADAAKANLFGTFSFTPTSKDESKSADVFRPFGTLNLSQNDPAKATIIDNSKPKSFTSISFSKDNNVSKEVIKPSPIFTASTNKQGISENIFTPVQKPNPVKSVVPELNDSGNAEEFVPTAEFQPVIPLPDLVDVKTGEENAEILFEAKGKLLRYDSGTKEWKERGIGQMKILKEKTVRLLMRREQVHKVCCNHQLLKNMEFSRMKASPNAVTWCAQDFSEQVLVNECFAIRFKLQETTLGFLDAIKRAKDLLDDNNVVKVEHKTDKKIKPIESEPVKSPRWKDKSGWTCKNCLGGNEGKVTHCVACETPKNEAAAKKPPAGQFSFGVMPKNQTTTFSFGATPSSGGFGDTFKPKQGSWECGSCMVRNEADKTSCVACQSPKEPSTEKVEKSETKGVDLSTGGLKFNFGIPSTTPQETVETKTLPSSGFGEMFKPKTGSWECKACYTRNEGSVCLSCQCPKDEPAPTKDSTLKGVDLDTGGLTFNFGISTPTPASKPAESQGFSFKLTPAAPKPAGEDEIVFGSPHKVGFEFTPRSPRRQSSSNAAEEDLDSSYVEEEEDNIYFKPVIPLPDKIEVLTGEEGEEVLYCHRAKLFRHSDGEWKERGIGEVKILLKPDAKKLRVLMRREQIHKICLNHYLTKDIAYSAKDDKTWFFYAPDYSEGEIEYNKFCLRFKTAEIAREFKTAVDKALGNVENEAGESADDSEVEIVFETQVTPEEEEEARRLQLPLKFMSYRKLPDCTCDQCKKDDQLLSNKTDVSKFTSSKIFGSNKSSPFGTPSSAPTNFSFANTSSKENETLKQMLIKPSILGSAATGNAFGFASTAVTAGGDTVPTNSSKSIFDTQQANFSTPKSSSVFGGNTTTTTTSLFGNAASTTPVFGASSPSIFGGGAAATGPLLFGSKPSATVFGGATTTNTSIFSGTGTSVFGGGNTSIFGGGGSTNSPIFGNNSLNTSKTTTSNETSVTPKSQSGTFSFASFAQEKEKKDDVVFNAAPDLSFSALASKSEQSSFQTKSGDQKNPFASLGAGAPVFGSQSEDGNSKQKDVNTSSDATDENYDPHYEPIIPLPDAIVVTTGEEDEEILFNERGKLFRFDNKEWKERGVGQIKVLHNPSSNTYRLLLRREAVHKIVLNQLVTADLDMKSHPLSSNAWIWAGMNFCENEHNLEKLLARFKNETIAQSFYDTVQKAIEMVKVAASKEIPATVENVSEYEGEEEEEEDEDDDDYDEEDDRTIIFEKECSFRELLPNQAWSKPIENCNLEVYYDADIFGSRISITDSGGNTLSNTLIGKNTIMERKPDIHGNECEWTAVEYIGQVFKWKTYSVTFESSDSAEECHAAYLESVACAEKADIVDEIPGSYHEGDM